MAPANGARRTSSESLSAREERAPDYARAERLQAEKEDLLRRVRERDERTTELQKHLGHEKERAQRSAEKFGGEAALRKAAEDAREYAERRLEEVQARCDELARSNEKLLAQQAAMSSEAKDKLEGAEAIRSNLQEGVQRLEAERDALQLEVGRIRPLLSSAEAELRSEKVSSKRLQDTLQASMQAAVQTLETERDTLRADVQQLIATTSAADADVRSERANGERLLDQMQKGHDRYVAILHEKIAAAAAEVNTEKAHRERLIEQMKVAHERDEKMLQERCSAAETRIDREAISAANAWRELETVRSELDSARRTVEALNDERRRQAEHIATVEAVLTQLRQDKTLMEQAQSQLIGLTTHISSRRQSQIDEAWAAIRSCKVAQHEDASLLLSSMKYGTHHGTGAVCSSSGRELQSQ